MIFPLIFLRNLSDPLSLFIFLIMLYYLLLNIIVFIRGVQPFFGPVGPLLLYFE